MLIHHVLLFVVTDCYNHRSFHLKESSVLEKDEEPEVTHLEILAFINGWDLVVPETINHLEEDDEDVSSGI